MTYFNYKTPHNLLTDFNQIQLRPVVVLVELPVGEEVELPLLEDPIYTEIRKIREKTMKLPDGVTELLLSAPTKNDNAMTMKEMKKSLFIVRFSFG